MLVASCSISPPIILRATGSPSRDLMTTIWGGLVRGVCPCGFITAETGRDTFNSSPLTNTDHQAGFPGKFSQQTSRLVAASNYLDHDQISCHNVSECQNKTEHCLLQGGSQTPWSRRGNRHDCQCGLFIYYLFKYYDCRQNVSISNYVKLEQ